MLCLLLTNFAKLTSAPHLKDLQKRGSIQRFWEPAIFFYLTNFKIYSCIEKLKCVSYAEWFLS